MKHARCSSCGVKHPADAFRKVAKGVCVWCQWASPRDRALARYRDKVRSDAALQSSAEVKGERYASRLRISEHAFLAWYCSQPDQCHYCGLKFKELSRLRLRRGGFGYFVSWDIDRKDTTKPYRAGNLALSCFACNMAKGNHFSEDEAMRLGRTVRALFRARLRDAAHAA